VVVERHPEREASGPHPNDRVGRYVLHRVIGVGAMGTVWAASDPELDRAVAIKILHADAARLRTRANFLREAQATARLVHRNVVTIHDVGVADDRLFLAMELVAGLTLRQWLQTPRGWREIVDVLRGAAMGLAAAHDAGIVHRDVKPDNVLLELHADGSVARVVVSDFGLAAAPDPSSSAITRADLVPSGEIDALEVTQDSSFQGTAAYAAPEQRGGTCDARSDQFSFCVTAHEALWGERPPAPTSGCAPRWLRRAVMRGLSSHPTQRFPDMRALSAALDPQRRRRAATIVAGVAACSAALGIAVASRTAEPERLSYCDRVTSQLDGVWDEPSRLEIEAAFLATHEPSAADAWASVSARIDTFASEWVEAQTQACLAQTDGTVPRDVLALRMTCLDRQLGRARAIGEALRVMDRDAVLRSSDSVAHLGSPSVCSDDEQLSRRAAARIDVDPRVQLELDSMLSRAEALAHTAKFAESEAIAQDALALAREVGDRWAAAEALLEIAVPRQWRQRPTAEQAFHDALSAALAVEHHRVAALSMIGLLELWDADTAGGAERAEQWERHCRATISAMGGDVGLEIELGVALGNVYLKFARYDEAEAAYRRALALREGSEHDILLAGAHANLASIEAARGRYEEALVGFRHSHALIEGVYGPRHPNAAIALVNVGSATAELGDLETAHQQHLRALEILEENFGREHAGLAPALRMLAWNGLARKRYADALPYAERALAIARRESGERDESTARSLAMVAAIELELGRAAESVAHCEEALVIARAALGADHPTVAEFDVECGFAATEAGHEAEARRHFETAIAVREARLGPDDPEIGRAWTGIAELELKLGHSRQAVVAATRAHELASKPGEGRNVAGPEAAFLLARTLMAAGEHARARRHAEDAVREFRAIGPSWNSHADEVVAWLQRSPR
jgi:eukaryotic-like serine/threonine-protein kinase